MSRVLAPGPDKRLAVDSWCSGPRLVVVTIEPIGDLAFPEPAANVDIHGAPLHCEWSGVIEAKSPGIHDRFEAAKMCRSSDGRYVVRSNAGTFCVRTAMSLSVIGGSGLWEVSVRSAEDTNAEARSEFELQRIVNTRANPAHKWLPHGHTYLEVISGWLAVGGQSIAPHKPISISLASLVGWEAIGIVRTYLEV